MADLRGRRAVFVPIILIMAGATATVGLLPGYAAIGVLAPVTLILLRAVQGFAAGGELGMAGVLICALSVVRRGCGPSTGSGRMFGRLTLAPDLDQIDAGVPQGVDEPPEGGIV